MLLASANYVGEGFTIYSLYHYLINYSVQEGFFFIGRSPDGRMSSRIVKISREKYGNGTMEYLRWWRGEAEKTNFHVLGLTTNGPAVERIIGYASDENKLNGWIAAAKKILKRMRERELIVEATEADREDRIKKEKALIMRENSSDRNGQLKLLKDKSYYRATRKGIKVGALVSDQWRITRLRLDRY